MLSRELQGMALWDRHKWLVNTYQASPARGKPSLRTDMDVLREHHQFIREDGGSVDLDAPWEERLAAKYYQTIIKEYAVVDLSRYKEMKVGLRWRTEPEVIAGKGQFECGSLSCTERFGLQSFEVPFTYKEQGVAKQALVKVRVCEECTPKLYWKKTKELKKLAKIVAAHASDAASPAVPAVEGREGGYDASEQRTGELDQPRNESRQHERSKKRDRCQHDEESGEARGGQTDEVHVSQKHHGGHKDERSKKSRPDVRAASELSDGNREHRADEADKLIQELLL